MPRTLKYCVLAGFLLTVPLVLTAPLSAQGTTASEDNLTGWGFGAGLSLTYDTGKHDRVEDAVLDANGVVRVNKKNNARARIMFETHYFFPYTKSPTPEQGVRAGWGPFVAAQPGESEIIEAVGIGVMFGWRRAAGAPEKRSSFNLGIGYVVDPNTKVLGDEFRENEAGPLGPDGSPLPIRLQMRDQGGILALASFTW